MLAVLHEIAANMRHGIIQKQDFKVVYVAPMKALAAEVTGAFSRRLGPLGMPMLCRPCPSSFLLRLQRSRVAPIKALAAEVTGAFSRRLGPLGMHMLCAEVLVVSL